MKKIIFPLYFFTLLSCFYLVAQEVPDSQDNVPSNSVRHFSASYTFGYRGLNVAPFHIGSPNNPVTVQEYCDFLNDMAPSDHFLFSSPYYDYNLMKTDSGWGCMDRACIYRTGKSLHYYYTPMPGCESDIIDAVAHSFSSNFCPIAVEFQKWRDTKKKNSAPFFQQLPLTK